MTDTAIFLTFDVRAKRFDVKEARRMALRLRELGNTFRGCTFCQFVPQWDSCPICDCQGTKTVNELPWEHDFRRPPQRSHTASGFTRKVKPRTAS